MAICQRTPGSRSYGVTPEISGPLPSSSVANPAAYRTRVISKLRTGPLFLVVQAVPSEALTIGAPGAGYGSRSGGAVGSGEPLCGFEFWVKPVNPVSSPLTKPAVELVPGIELSGS